MIRGIRDFYYNVSDMKRAIAFYSDALGMKPTYQTDHWTSMSCGGGIVGLHWAEGSEVPRVPRDEHGAHAGGTITLESDDVAADRKKIEAAGGKVLGASDPPWGQMLIFEDLDGNVLKLMRPK